MENNQREGLVGRASKFVAGALPGLAASGLLALGGLAIAAIQGKPMPELWQAAAMAGAAAGAVGGMLRAADTSTVGEAWERGSSVAAGTGALAVGAGVCGVVALGLIHMANSIWPTGSVVSAGAAAGAAAAALATPIPVLAGAALGGASVFVSAVDAIAPMNRNEESLRGALAEGFAPANTDRGRLVSALIPKAPDEGGVGEKLMIRRNAQKAEELSAEMSSEPAKLGFASGRGR